MPSQPFNHSYNNTDNTTTHNWIQKGAIANNPLVSALLLWCSCILHKYAFTASTFFIAGSNNHLAD
eukprot:7598433-Ditylum_brightwellii.AAC.1